MIGAKAGGPRLPDLHAYFARRLPARLGEMAEAWDAVRAAAWSADSLRLLHRLAHSLAGTGSTFGFPDVSTTARDLEHLLETALAGAAPPDDAMARRVEQLLGDLDSAAREG
jgi:chemotaxis protein histidine kinase CheA